jgi:AraC-like DNA-binding protein
MKYVSSCTIVVDRSESRGHTARTPSSMKKYFTHDDPVLPVHHPRVLLETAAAHGADREALLVGTGITTRILDDPDARISYKQFSALEENALRLTGNPALGLEFGRNVHLSHLGLLGLAIMSSANAGAALELALRYYRQLAPGWDLELRIDGQRAFLSARETISRGFLRPFATEALLGGLYGLSQQVLARRLPIIEVRLNYPRPAYYEKYREFVQGPIRFDQPVTETEFEASILREPIAGSDPITNKLAEQYIATEAARGSPVGGLVAQVRRVLASHDRGRPDPDDVAKALQTSTRSLRRGLQQMGTSFQELLDEARRARAEEWIRGSNMKLQQIALQLGFSDVRSFRRAFKRWTGRSPNALRNGSG